jgi:hypothetical protein
MRGLRAFCLLDRTGESGKNRENSVDTFLIPRVEYRRKGELRRGLNRYKERRVS